MNLTALSRPLDFDPCFRAASGRDGRWDGRFSLRVMSTLAALRRIGPWTVEMIAMRALADPDAYPAGDLILRRALGDPAPSAADRIAEPWLSYHDYAAQHLRADFLASSARRDLA